MIFVRSRRPAVLMTVASTLVAAALIAATARDALDGGLVRATLLGLAAVFAATFVLRASLRLKHWPLASIAFFRDAMVVRTGHSELRAPWDGLELITLAAPSEWTELAWPEVRLTDRLTVRMRGGGSFRLHPASFGLDPIACRDLLLRLRDEPAVRGRLPEFDSELDLLARPAAVGELMKPRL